jgi:alpha-1,3-rhamnosyl/mannosyltransferase
MKIAIDLQHAVGTATGIGEYSAGLADALEAAGVHVVRLSEPRLDPWRFDRRLLWDQVLFPLQAQRSGADLLHCTAGTIPAAAALPCVVTVHDVAWLRVQQHTRWYARSYFGAFSLAGYSRAARIVVDSAFSRDELFEVTDLDPSRVAVVYPGVSNDFGAVVRTPDAEALILAVGTVEPRKNLAAVIRAIVDVPGAQLVSVGPATPYREQCEALARDLGVADRVAFRGYVARAELLDLYARAAVAVAPSTYEGFGYAAAQALCAGVPLVASNASSLPEVVQGDALLLPPGDTAAWSAALRALLGDRETAQRAADAARARALSRLSWRATARAMIGVYRDAFATLR